MSNAVLLLGLLLFLGVHSVALLAPQARQRFVAARGENAWKGLYSIVAAVGLVLIVWGYGLARPQLVVLWPAPPVWMRHLAGLLMLVSFVLLTAAYVPRNSIQARLHHPMLLGVKVWAFAHLIANNTLADLLLFGGFLAWAVVDYSSLRRRDRAAGKAYPPGSAGRTALAVVIGVGLWAAFGQWVHAWMVGMRPW